MFYRTSSPSGPLPCYPSLKFTIAQSRATGIADHILPLGDLFNRYAFNEVRISVHKYHFTAKEVSIYQFIFICSYLSVTFARFLHVLLPLLLLLLLNLLLLLLMLK